MLTKFHEWWLGLERTAGFRIGISKNQPAQYAVGFGFLFFSCHYLVGIRQKLLVVIWYHPESHQLLGKIAFGFLLPSFV